MYLFIIFDRSDSPKYLEVEHGRTKQSAGPFLALSGLCTGIGHQKPPGGNRSQNARNGLGNEEKQVEGCAILNVVECQTNRQLLMLSSFFFYGLGLELMKWKSFVVRKLSSHLV